MRQVDLGTDQSIVPAKVGLGKAGVETGGPSGKTGKHLGRNREWVFCQQWPVAVCAYALARLERRASGHAVWPWTGAVAEKLGGCCEPVAEAEAGGE